MKLIELILDDDEAIGVEAISVVENPAIESDFIALSNQEIKLAEISKEKRLLMGALLIPNKPIYRKSGEDEYHIFFSKDTITKASQMYLQNGNQSNSTLEALLIVKQALALQETIMDLKRITFKGVEAVGSAGVSTAQNVAESSKIGFPQNLITIAGAIAQGVSIVSSVKKAVSKTKAATNISAPIPNIATPSIPSLPPAFNVVGQSSTNQLASAIGGQSQQPVKAYVVSGDVTNAQEMDRNIIQGASI